MSSTTQPQFALPEPIRSHPLNYRTLLHCFESYARSREDEIIRLQSIVDSHESQARGFAACCDGLREQIRQLVVCRDRLQEELRYVITCHQTQSRLVDAQQELVNTLQSEIAQYQERSHIRPRALQINPILLSQAQRHYPSHEAATTSGAASGVLLTANSDTFSANVLLSMAESNPGDTPSTGVAQQPQDFSPNAQCRRANDRSEVSEIDYE